MVKSLSFNSISNQLTLLSSIDFYTRHNFSDLCTNLREVSVKFFLVQTELKYLVLYTHIIVSNLASLKIKTILIGLHVHLIERVPILELLIFQPMTVSGKPIVRFLTDSARHRETSVSHHKHTRSGLSLSTFSSQTGLFIHLVSLGINDSILQSIRYSFTRTTIINLRSLTRSRSRGTTRSILDTTIAIHEVRI